MFKRLAT